MNREEFLKKRWVRVVTFLWLVVFPLLFIAVPVLEMFMNDAPKSYTPVWALIVWMLGPWAASIVLKYAGNGDTGSSDNEK